MKTRTMRGKLIDMAALASANAHTRAIGNANMNARGDKLDSRGNIVKTREQIDEELVAYHRENPNAVRNATLTALEAEVFTPAEAMGQAPRQMVQGVPVSADEKVAIPARPRKVISED